VQLDEGEYLAHYGILRKSGRYPWGTGANPNQRSKSFLDVLEQHKKDGLSEAEIAKLYDDRKNGFPFTTSDLRAIKSRSVNIQKQEQIRTAEKLRDKGMSPSAIGRQMGVNESSVRSLLEPGRKDKLDQLQRTAEMLKRQVAEKEFVDVGAQVERDLPLGEKGQTAGISKDKFNTALSMLKEEGYSVHPLWIQQAGTGEYTRYRVLVKPGVTKHDVFLNRDKVKVISERSEDAGRTWQDLSLKPPLNISSKRVAINYKEDGGAHADGVIYVRPGVKDVSLGKSQYAQVRIAIDGTHYLKGMAVYKNDLPPGVDLVFNTNKSNTGNKHDAMKPMKKDKDGNVDPTNPFGASIKPIGGQIKNERGRVTSAMNKVNDEGDWDNWSRNLSRQVLSKQSPDLAKSQLDLTFNNRRKEFEEIKSLTNPQIKKKLLESFSDETDAASVHLKAANMPRQATRVLLPLRTIKEHEIYAPSFKDGERVALVRFPHAGRFEIPELTVNNRNKEARELFGVGKGGQHARDAVGIHPKVAERLSGADFDGDAVVVIPNNRGSIKSARPLEGLKDFDPQQYHVPLGPPSKEHPNGKPIITDARKQTEMGIVTNLISDMTVKGANTEELARAVRHSMVVIDSEKHNLDFKASERDNGIRDLRKRYQGVHESKGQLKGAATLITRATARADVPKRKPAKTSDTVTRGIDKATGKKAFEPTGEKDKHGNIKTFRSKKLAETDDATTLLSDHGGTDIEKVYARHSNKLKALANESRKEMISTKNIPYSTSAKAVYSKEVEALNGKLNIALKNAPRERQAQVVAQHIISQRRKANPQMDSSDLKKIKGQALEEARLRTGAKKHLVEITDREWEAIQAGAISNDKLEKILNNTDVDKLRERATPRAKTVMTSSKTSLAKQMLSTGYTYAEIADRLGVPVSTVKSGLSEEVNP
jgi:DNA-directed RNA polymerase specialized sigma24 family protein